MKFTADGVRRHALRRQAAASRSRARTRVTACSRRRRSSSISRFGNEQRATSATCSASVNATPNGSVVRRSPTTEIGRYCMQGREAVHLVRREVLRHPPLRRPGRLRRTSASRRRTTRRSRRCSTKGTANIILVNMVTGVRTRITTMKPGQYALFPHFRSDGWIYFLVRDKQHRTRSTRSRATRR